MKIEKIPFNRTGYFGHSFIKYIEEHSSLRPFYNLYPRIENFQKQIKEKQLNPSNREILVKTLRQQYDGYEIEAAVQKNLELLGKDNTFTVTTGHQLNIFTGPLYFIYKIVTAVNACLQLKQEYPEFNFVPVYWMASEDHDFEEISYFWLNNQKYQWKTEQKGGVGRFDPSELKEILDKMPGANSVFRDAYLKHGTLADAVRFYVNELFGNYGLIVLDADDPSLKAEFSEVIKDDILEHTAFGAAESTSKELKELGFHSQIQARPINFFYLRDGLRERLEQQGDSYRVLNSEILFTESQIKQEIADHPERFSPNVILRPLYQEMILPNLAYIGGPAEVIYWFQLKEVFKSFQVPFPILLPRNFGLVIPRQFRRKWDKTGWPISSLFDTEEELIKRYTLSHSKHELNLDRYKEIFVEEFKQIAQNAGKIDPTLTYSAQASLKRMQNSVEKLEKKMIRAEKRNMLDRTRQISDVKNFLFPGGSLQERRDNFLNFALEDPKFIQNVIDSFDPFDLKFHILSYE